MIWEGHPTWRATLSFHIKGFAVTLVVVRPAAARPDGSESISIGISEHLVVGVALTIARRLGAPLLHAVHDHDEAAPHPRGILSKTESSTNVDRIQNITVKPVTGRPHPEGGLDRLRHGERPISRPIQLHRRRLALRTSATGSCSHARRRRRARARSSTVRAAWPDYPRSVRHARSPPDPAAASRNPRSDRSRSRSGRRAAIDARDGDRRLDRHGDRVRPRRTARPRARASTSTSSSPPAVGSSAAAAHTTVRVLPRSSTSSPPSGSDPPWSWQSATTTSKKRSRRRSRRSSRRSTRRVRARPLAHAAGGAAVVPPHERRSRAPPSDTPS